MRGAKSALRPNPGLTLRTSNRPGFGRVETVSPGGFLGYRRVGEGKGRRVDPAPAAPQPAAPARVAGRRGGERRLHQLGDRTAARPRLRGDGRTTAGQPGLSRPAPSRRIADGDPRDAPLRGPP